MQQHWVEVSFMPCPDTGSRPHSNIRLRSLFLSRLPLRSLLLYPEAYKIQDGRVSLYFSVGRFTVSAIYAQYFTQTYNTKVINTLIS